MHDVGSVHADPWERYLTFTGWIEGHPEAINEKTGHCDWKYVAQRIVRYLKCIEV